MTRSSLGCHWIRVHPDGHDFEHVARMQYPSVKTFEWMSKDRNFCADLVAAMPKDAYFLARNHPRSEDKEVMFRDPIATGIRHANEWQADVLEGRCFLPVGRTFFLGINEPDATSGDRSAIDRYTAAFLDRLRQHGLRGGAFNFSTGHPRTKDGTPNTAPDYTVFEMAHQAIVRGSHIGVLHIYGTAITPCAPGHYDRLKSCPWTDVQWVVGECGIDEHVIGGGPHHGWLHSLGGNANAYADWLDRLIMGVNDPRIHSWQVFTYDFSHPWDSFDTRPARSVFETYNWKHGAAQPRPPAPQPPAPPQPPRPQPSTSLIHPVAGAPISQHFYQNPEAYAQYGLPGHNGTDFAAPLSTPIRAIAAGIVAWADTDHDYGLYVRLWHEQLNVYSFYAHMDRHAVAQGTLVTAGQVIGYVGSTGNSTGPHLHLEIRLAKPDGSYSDLTPMPKGRADGETWCAMHGLKL